MNKLFFSASMLLCCASLGCNTGDTNGKPTSDDDTGALDTDDTDTTGDDTDDTDPTGDTDDTDPTGDTDDTGPTGDTAETGDTGTDTGGTDTGGTDTGGTDTGGAANAVVGTYGPDAILPIQAAYWIGQPGDPTESGGGPFVYLFSSPVTCEDISQAGWLDTIPADTQVLEMIIGTTTPGTTLPVAHSAGADQAEVNWVVAGGSESRANAGSVTVTALADGNAVDGTLDVMFSDGAANGTFHASYCANGQEF